MQATVKESTITFGNTTIEVTGSSASKMADILSSFINYQIGNAFCPKCGSPNACCRWDVHFDNEKRCPDCRHCWDPHEK